MNTDMEMVSFFVDKNAGGPLYEQLYEQIKREIVSGKLPFGSRLSSKLKLSEQLHISKNTVETAYDQLVVEGYVEAQPKRGFFVCFEDRLGYHPEGKTPPVNPKTTARNYAVDFHPGRIDPAYFPFDKWRKCAREVMDGENSELLQLGHPQGEYTLRDEIASYLYFARGVRCHADQIVVGAGIEVLLLQLHLLLPASVCYGLEYPGYTLTHALISKIAGRVESVTLDGEGIEIEQLTKKKVDIAYVTPSHQFPYGSVMTASRRAGLLAWAAEGEGRYIIEDDYDSEFRYAGKPVKSLQSMDRQGSVIYLGTFSKALIPSLRVSYMVLPESLLRRYQERLGFFNNTVSRIDQEIIARFMQSGGFEKHINRMRKLYRRKLELLKKILAPYKHLIRVRGDNAGFYLLLEADLNLPEAELIERADRENLKIYGLSDYMPEEADAPVPKILLGFAGVPEDKLIPGAEALLRCWKVM